MKVFCQNFSKTRNSFRVLSGFLANGECLAGALQNYVISLKLWCLIWKHDFVTIFVVMFSRTFIPMTHQSGELSTDSQATHTLTYNQRGKINIIRGKYIMKQWEKLMFFWNPPVIRMLCKRLVSRAGTSNYTPQHLWDVITCPCPSYLLLIKHFSYMPKLDPQLVALQPIMS